MNTTRPTVALAAALLVCGGCASGGRHAAASPEPSTSEAPTASSTGHGLHVTATLDLPPSNALVATPDWLWVLGGPSGVLTQIDPATNTVVRKLTTPHPPGFGTYADGSLWIASLIDDAVMQVDADSGTVLRTIESAHGKPFFRPVGIAATGKDLWVVNHGDDSVRSTLVRLDARSGAVTGTTELPGHHAGGPMLVGGQIWISLTTEGTVVRVDPGTGFVVGAPIRVDTGSCLSGSVVGGDLWLSSLDLGADLPCRNASRRIDAVTTALSPVVYGPGKSLYDFAEAGGSVWASDVGHTLYRVDVGSGAIHPALRLDGPDDYDRLAAAFGSLWVLGGETGRLVRVDVS